MGKRRHTSGVASLGLRRSVAAARRCCIHSQDVSRAWKCLAGCLRWPRRRPAGDTSGRGGFMAGGLPGLRRAPLRRGEPSAPPTERHVVALPRRWIQGIVHGAAAARRPAALSFAALASVEASTALAFARPLVWRRPVGRHRHRLAVPRPHHVRTVSGPQNARVRRRRAPQRRRRLRRGGGRRRLMRWWRKGRLWRIQRRRSRRPSRSRSWRRRQAWVRPCHLPRASVAKEDGARRIAELRPARRQRRRPGWRCRHGDGGRRARDGRRRREPALREALSKGCR